MMRTPFTAIDFHSESKLVQQIKFWPKFKIFIYGGLITKIWNQINASMVHLSTIYIQISEILDHMWKVNNQKCVFPPSFLFHT